MCFSATASFATATFLMVLGAWSVKRTNKRNALFFSTIPLLFAIQQACEGVVWLSFNNTELAFLRMPAATGFLFFAFIIWPIWIPLSLYHIEFHTIRKKILMGLLIIGFILSCVLSTYLFVMPFNVTVYDHHINYAVNAPLWLNVIATITYLQVIVLPFFISSHKQLIAFGTLLVASYLISYYFYYYVHISVWCFFAALMSAAIVWYVPRIQSQ